MCCSSSRTNENIRRKWAQKKKDESKQSLQDFRDWQAECRRKKEEELANGPSEETLERRAKFEAFMAKNQAEAKIEAEEERRVFSDPDAARKAGMEFWNSTEEKDTFGNIVRSVTKKDVIDVGAGEGKQGDVEEEEGQKEVRVSQERKTWETHVGGARSEATKRCEYSASTILTSPASPPLRLASLITGHPTKQEQRSLLLPGHGSGCGQARPG